MSKYNTGIEFKHDSGLFNHYKKYFDQPTIMTFKAKNSLDSSYEGFIAFKKKLRPSLRKILNMSQMLTIMLLWIHSKYYLRRTLKAKRFVHT